MARSLAFCGCNLSDKPAQFFNQIPHLLSIGNGVIDLNSLTLLPRKRQHYFTYCLNLEISQHQLDCIKDCTLALNRVIVNETQVAQLKGVDDRDSYDLDDPRYFDSLLKKDVFAHAPEIAEFLQCFYGYGITGFTDQQYYLFNYGCGSNCKSLISELKRTTFDPICKIISYDAICSTNSNNDEIYEAAYSRNLIVDETNDPDDPNGKEMNWTSIKKFGSGNEISPSAKYKTNRTFTPQFNLEIYTNFKLKMPKNCGFADRRRVLLAKWQKVYLDSAQPIDRNKMEELQEQGRGHMIGRKDRELKKKLEDRRVGFALWVIQGAWMYCH